MRRLARLAQHVPDLLRYRRAAAAADVVHFQWLPVQAIDWALLPPRRPRLITAHDVLPREAGPGQRAGQRRLYARMDAVIVHSEHGAARLRDEAGVDPEKVHVIPHGVFHELAALDPAPLPAEGPGPPQAASRAARRRGPIALCFGLMRPYKGLDVLLEAWRRADLPSGAELWMVGRPRMDVSALRAASPPGVRWVTRFVSDAELAALFRAADLAVLPYREIDQSGVLYTALAFGTPLLLTAVGGFPEVARTGAAELVAPGDPDALARALGALLADPARRARAGARPHAGPARRTDPTAGTRSPAARSRSTSRSRRTRRRPARSLVRCRAGASRSSPVSTKPARAGTRSDAVLSRWTMISISVRPSSAAAQSRSSATALPATPRPRASAASQ